GTGFSHGEDKKADGKDEGGKGGGNPNKPFWNVRGDLTSLGSVLRLWLTRHERWPSPVYLVGESYGGYRVAALAHTLVEDIGLTPNGLVMISPALDMNLLHDSIVDPMDAAFKIPSYAATAASLAGKPLSADDAAKVEQ